MLSEQLDPIEASVILSVGGYVIDDGSRYFVMNKLNKEIGWLSKEQWRIAERRINRRVEVTATRKHWAVR